MSVARHQRRRRIRGANERRRFTIRTSFSVSQSLVLFVVDISLFRLVTKMSRTLGVTADCESEAVVSEANNRGFCSRRRKKPKGLGQRQKHMIVMSRM